MNSLGIDFGTKHLGIALATGPLAEPLTTLPTKSAIPAIIKLISDYKIDTIIVGLGDERLSNEVHNFLTQLRTSHPQLSYQVVDETLSSKDARLSLMHTSQTRRKQNEHAVAATLILQSWIDEKNLAI